MIIHSLSVQFSTLALPAYAGSQCSVMIQSFYHSQDIYVKKLIVAPSILKIANFSRMLFRLSHRVTFISDGLGES